MTARERLGDVFRAMAVQRPTSGHISCTDQRAVFFVGGHVDVLTGCRGAQLYGRPGPDRNVALHRCLLWQWLLRGSNG